MLSGKLCGLFVTFQSSSHLKSKQAELDACLQGLQDVHVRTGHKVVAFSIRYLFFIPLMFCMGQLNLVRRLQKLALKASPRTVQILPETRYELTYGWYG
jgi:hypothetical protein